MSTIEILRQAMAQQMEGQRAKAERVYLQVLKEEPDNPDANHLLGLVRSQQDKDEEAVLLIEKAIALSPNASAYHHNIAGIYRRMGKLQSAEAEYRRAIELKPDYGEAYQGLAEMVKFSHGDPLLGKILSQLESPVLRGNTKACFYFAAGKYFDDVGDYPSAFDHYSMGNNAADKTFDAPSFNDLIKNCIYQFSPRSIRKIGGGGSASEKPVFVLGMPRSGTTLVEQILASHSQVLGAGELNDMKYIAKFGSHFVNPKQAYPNFLPFLAQQHYQRLASEYLRRIEELAGSHSASRVVDKHPLNFQFVGLIFSMFPNAKIIHTVRHPLDTCLSCFFQNFSRGQHYSFDLGTLTSFYLGYQRLMEHWEMLYPGKILTVEYENVISDQENQSRRLLDYCGLEFEAACLKFYETERTVKTASFKQVREPVYRTSKNRWKNYQRELMPVAKALNIPIQSPVKITGINTLGV